MELVRVGHRDLGEGGKVLCTDRSGHPVHSVGNDVIDSVLEQRRGLHRSLHSAGGRSALLVIRNDADERLHLGPVFLGGYLDSERVGP